MKSIFVAMLGMGFVLLAASLVNVEAGDHESQIRDLLAQKIAICQAKANYVNSNSPCLCQYGRVNQAKAAYIESNLDDLVQEMIELGIEPKGYKIDYFLTNRFRRSAAFNDAVKASSASISH